MSYTIIVTQPDGTRDEVTSPKLMTEVEIADAIGFSRLRAEDLVIVGPYIRTIRTIPKKTVTVVRRTTPTSSSTVNRDLVNLLNALTIQDRYSDPKKDILGYVISINGNGNCKVHRKRGCTNGRSPAKTAFTQDHLDRGYDFPGYCEKCDNY